MTLFQRRQMLGVIAGTAAMLASGVASGAFAEERTSVKIGSALSLTGSGSRK